MLVLLLALALLALAQYKATEAKIRPGMLSSGPGGLISSTIWLCTSSNTQIARFGVCVCWSSETTKPCCLDYDGFPEMPFFKILECCLAYDIAISC